ncbi:SH3 domain-containing protein [Sinorhizobium meliloti]|uniref:SH3 domain-containing protein n=1 Tax=Rhizobium meliloti TaxID=382 RepID=UPI002090B2E9|nr:SH3 domain-containing protein [Sinorhizobium meliloti]MCO5965061.1 SH3 domain-containing protein [Sinorhizobium meliloti]
MKRWRIMAAAILSALTIGFSMFAPVDASAATSAVAVTNVNLRAGPSTRYPVVITLPVHAALTVYGCTANTSWCDVSWGRDRGWVAANYVQVFYRGSSVVVTPTVAPAIGLAVVTFNQTYWNTYYVGRPWYGEWNVYYGGGSRSVVRGCNDDGCGAAAVTRGPYGGGRAAVGGCQDGNCGGAAVTRGPYGGGRAAVGGCNDEKCAGAAVTRGPLGNTVVRHGSVSRD